MKIAFIVGMFPSLSETFILNQITGLMELGHEVDIFSVNKSTENKKHDLINKFNLMERVYYFPQIPKNKILRIVKGKLLFLINFFKDPKKLLKSINIFNKDKDFMSLKILYYSIPFLGKDYDIIHSHFGNNGIIGVYLKKGGVCGKFVTTFHGYDLSEFLKLYGTAIYNTLFHYCDLCLPISDYWGKKLLELGCDKKKIKVHRMGIEQGNSTFENKVKYQKKIRLLTVGRLVEKKGHKHSIRAVSDLINDKIDLEYTIAGSGPLLNSLKMLVSKLKMDNRIKFKGECTGEEVKKLYKNSDIFILHSITPPSCDKEGIPVVLMEAMDKGLPVISTNHSGIPELVSDKESGLLVNEKDVEALKQSIEYLAENREECIRMGKKGKNMVNDLYNIKKQNRKLEKIFSDLLS